MNKYLEILINNNKEIINDLLLVINNSIEQMNILHYEKKEVVEDDLLMVFLKNVEKYKINNKINLSAHMKFVDEFNKNRKVVECLFIFFSKNERIALKIIFVDNNNIGYSFSIAKKDSNNSKVCLFNNKNTIVYDLIKEDNINFNFIKLENKKEMFRVLSDKTEKVFSKNLQIAINNNIEMFADYFFLNKEIDKELIDMLNLENDFKVELNEEILKKFRIDVNKVDLKKNFNSTTNKTVNTL